MAAAAAATQNTDLSKVNYAEEIDKITKGLDSFQEQTPTDRKIIDLYEEFLKLNFLSTLYFKRTNASEETRTHLALLMGKFEILMAGRENKSLATTATIEVAINWTPQVKECFGDMTDIETPIDFHMDRYLTLTLGPFAAKLIAFIKMS